MASDCEAPTSPIPTDIIVNILLRLRVRDVCRLRGVSKSWRALISDPVFQRNHREKDTLLLVTTIRRRKNAQYSLLDVESKSLEVLGYGPPATVFACRDLVCGYNGHNVYICNPVMKKWINLPCSSNARLVLVGYIASTSTYMMFSMLNGVGVCFKYEVLTVGSNHWRAVDGPPGDAMLGLNFVDTGAIIDGSVYLLWHDTRQRHDIITAFDLKEEAWSFVPIPSDRYHDVVPVPIRYIMEMGGQLCLAYWVCSGIELWLLKGFHEDMPIWEKGCIIDMSILANYPGCWPLSIEQGGGKIFVCAITHDKMPRTFRLMCYDSKDKTMEEIYSGQSNFTASFYTESLMALSVKGF